MSLCESCAKNNKCPMCDRMNSTITFECKGYQVKTYDVITDGLKHDGGKPRLSLVPPILIRAVGKVMTHGAEKYGEASYKNVEPKRYRSALMRHICKWLKDPHGKDEDSGLPHLWHIACNVAFLLELDKEKPKKRTLKVVVVRFNNKTNKTYYYEYIGDEPVHKGDIVTVETPYQETAEVEVVDVMRALEGDIKFELKPATKRREQNDR